MLSSFSFSFSLRSFLPRRCCVIMWFCLMVTNTGKQLYVFMGHVLLSGRTSLVPSTNPRKKRRKGTTRKQKNSRKKLFLPAEPLPQSLWTPYRHISINFADCKICCDERGAPLLRSCFSVLPEISEGTLTRFPCSFPFPLPHQDASCLSPHFQSE